MALPRLPAARPACSTTRTRLFARLGGSSVPFRDILPVLSSLGAGRRELLAADAVNTIVVSQTLCVSAACGARRRRRPAAWTKEKIYVGSDGHCQICRLRGRRGARGGRCGACGGTPEDEHPSICQAGQGRLAPNRKDGTCPRQPPDCRRPAAQGQADPPGRCSPRGLYSRAAGGDGGGASVAADAHAAVRWW